MIKIKFIFIASITTIFFMGCIKQDINLDKIKISESPTFAFPIGNASFNLGQIQEKFDTNSYFYNQANEEFELRYGIEVFNLKAKDIIEIPKQTFQTSIVLMDGEIDPVVGATAGLPIQFSNENEMNFEIKNGAKIDSITVKKGNIKIDLNSEFKHGGTLNLSIPSLRKNGIPLALTIPINYSGTVPVTSTENIDLQGYAIILNEVIGSDNSFLVDVTVDFVSSGDGLNGNESIDFDIEFNVDNFKSIWGYFGQDPISISKDTFAIDLLKDLGDAEIYFKDPVFEVQMKNSVGVSADINLNLDFKPEEEAMINFSGDGLDDFPMLQSPAIINQITYTQHKITNDNTTPKIFNIFQRGKGDLIYSSDLVLNPDGETVNFLTEESEISCEATIRLPMDGYINNLSFQDTFKFDIDSLIDFGPNEELTEDDVEQVQVRLIVQNGLPIGTKLQAYFLDENNLLIDSLFKDGLTNFFESAEVNFQTGSNYGVVTKPKKTVLDIEISNSDFVKLKNNHTKQIYFKALGSTDGAGEGKSVKIFPEYTFEISASAKIELNIDLTK